MKLSEDSNTEHLEQMKTRNLCVITKLKSYRKLDNTSNISKFPCICYFIKMNLDNIIRKEKINWRWWFLVLSARLLEMEYCCCQYFHPGFVYLAVSVCCHKHTDIV